MTEDPIEARANGRASLVIPKHAVQQSRPTSASAAPPRRPILHLKRHDEAASSLVESDVIPRPRV